MENHTSLYAKDSKGKIRIWSIWSEENFIFMEYGQVGGEMIENSEPVNFGKQTRTKNEQIVMRIQSRINKKLDCGYTTTHEGALLDARTNTLGYPRQMGAQSLTSLAAAPNDGVYIQHKLNGLRCLIINDAGKLTAYSKGGKPILTIPEILKELKGQVPEGWVLDGELYHHGTHLQTIMSWVRRRQENTLKLTYKCFDIIPVEPMVFSDRHVFLNYMKFGSRSEYIKTKFRGGDLKLLKRLKKALEHRYEGLMLRDPNGFYECNKRSKNVLKVKKKITSGTEDSFMLDDEFLIVGMKASVDGWAVLMCETEHGKKFNVSAPGNVPEKTKILENKDDYIGGHVRVEFESYTKDGKPVEAVALMFREKHKE